MSLETKQQIISLLHNKIVIDTELSNLLADDSLLEQTEELIDMIAKKYLLLNENQDDGIDTNVKELIEEEDQQRPVSKKREVILARNKELQEEIDKL